jgi:hypothetical protein
MNYINKNTGKVAAHLNFGTHPNTWEVYPADDNRYRILKDGKLITAVDLNIGSGLIEVGKLLPGYNRVVTEILYVIDDDKEYFEVAC